MDEWIPDNRFMQPNGVRDSREQAIAYLDAVVGDHDDTPGANRARRLAYVEEAPAMLDFLASRGIRLRRLPSWPDYYDAPGESVPGRTVVSELFDSNQLGEWKSRSTQLCWPAIAGASARVHSARNSPRPSSSTDNPR